MQQIDFLSQLRTYPVIAAVKADAGLKQALQSDCRVIFLLYGSIMELDVLCRRVKDSGKTCMLHMDMIDGLAPRDISVDYIAHHTAADGILSTKPNLVRRAAGCGLLGVQRFFLLDSMALANIERQYPDTACAIEILPGLMPKIISRVSSRYRGAVIAGGLIRDREDAQRALQAGARAVSTTCPDAWVW